MTETVGGSSCCSLDPAWCSSLCWSLEMVAWATCGAGEGSWAVVVWRSAKVAGRVLRAGLSSAVSSCRGRTDGSAGAVEPVGVVWASVVGCAVGVAVTSTWSVATIGVAGTVGTAAGTATVGGASSCAAYHSPPAIGTSKAAASKGQAHRRRRCCGSMGSMSAQAAGSNGNAHSSSLRRAWSSNSVRSLMMQGVFRERRPWWPAPFAGCYGHVPHATSRCLH